jgi:hypothetical protein
MPNSHASRAETLGAVEGVEQRYPADGLERQACLWLRKRSSTFITLLTASLVFDGCARKP